uniref:Uncharacterized protein n=1 Tax=Physcomitrium patens TaxID=3218 RepID=A0A7I3Z6S9_PHYPA
MVGCFRWLVFGFLLQECLGFKLQFIVRFVVMGCLVLDLLSYISCGIRKLRRIVHSYRGVLCFLFWSSV